MNTSEKDLTIDNYIASQPEKIRETLITLRQTIKNAAPEAQELISYQMPAFKFHGMLAWFAVHTNHYGVYMRPKILSAFKDKLQDYDLTKSAIRIPMSEPVPETLIAEMIKYAAKDNLELMEMKKLAKSKK